MLDLSLRLRLRAGVARLNTRVRRSSAGNRVIAGSESDAIHRVPARASAALSKPGVETPALNTAATPSGGARSTAGAAFFRGSPPRPKSTRRVAPAISCGVEQLAARVAHNHEVAGSSPAPATCSSPLSAGSRLTAARRFDPSCTRHDNASRVTTQALVAGGSACVPGVLSTPLLGLGGRLDVVG